MTNEQIISIATESGSDEELLDYLAEHAESLFQAWFDENQNELTNDDDTNRILALMQHTEDNYDECKTYIDDGSYLVLTDDEADERWEEYLQSYLDECVLPELPESAQRYFDEAAWISDAKQDGRGHSLSSYDGCEHEESSGSDYYYIYKN